MTVAEIKSLLALHNLAPKYRLGQNFLHDRRIIDLICQEIESFSPHKIIEVGPGLGALSQRLLSISPELVLIEKDPDLAILLQTEILKEGRYELYNQDVLDFPVEQFSKAQDLVICSNLPYLITSKFFLKVLTSLPQAKAIVLMLQKEAAERLLAPVNTKQYGPASVLASLYGQAKKVLLAPASAFYPQPRVKSLVLSLTRQEGIYPDHFQHFDFLNFLDLVFAQRRQTLASNLKRARSYNLDLCPFDLKLRAEQLEPRDLLDLYLFFA